jgi:hypothetical protein
MHGAHPASGARGTIRAVGARLSVTNTAVMIADTAHRPPMTSIAGWYPCVRALA